MVAAENEQTFKNTFTGAGVQRGNDEMPGKRSAYGDVRGLFVANFADDEHLRVLAQEMPRGFCEIQSAGFVDFGLHDAGNNLFGGGFDRDDVAPAEFGEKSQT